MSYSVVDMFELWEYKVTCFDKDSNAGGLFAEYVNMFLKLKQESSGYPSWVQSEEDKERYIEDYWRAERIALDKASLSKNAGQRTLAKLKLNSMWGKWAQHENKSKRTILDSEKEFYQLLTCRSTEVANLIFPNDDVASFSSKYFEYYIAARKSVNVAVAAYLTTQAPLKLYEYLSKLCQSVLFFDTDSVIFIQKDKEPQMSKQEIIWMISQISSRCMTLLSKNLYRVFQRTMCSRYFAPQPEK